MAKNRKLITSIAIPVIGGSIIGGVASKSAKSTYQQLGTPELAPPSWVFPVAWTSLYATMGTAKYYFDQKPASPDNQRIGSALYRTQLFFNFLWSFLFFRWNLRGAALFDAILLWISILLNGYYFSQHSKTAAILMLPYLGWVTYAVALNYKTWSDNKGLSTSPEQEM